MPHMYVNSILLAQWLAIQSFDSICHSPLPNEELNTFLEFAHLTEKERSLGGCEQTANNEKKITSISVKNCWLTTDSKLVRIACTVIKSSTGKYCSVVQRDQRDLDKKLFYGLHFWKNMYFNL